MPWIDLTLWYQTQCFHCPKNPLSPPTHLSPRPALGSRLQKIMSLESYNMQTFPFGFFCLLICTQVSSLPPDGQSSFPLSAGHCPVLCTHCSLSILILKGVFVAFCHLRAQSCCKHPCVQVFVWTQIFNSFGQIPSSMIPGFYEKSVFSKNLLSCLPGWMCYQQLVRVPFAPNPCQHLLSVF